METKAARLFTKNGIELDDDDLCLLKNGDTIIISIKGIDCYMIYLGENFDYSIVMS
jgi:hypothetical protein